MKKRTTDNQEELLEIKNKLMQGALKTLQKVQLL